MSGYVYMVRDDDGNVIASTRDDEVAQQWHDEGADVYRR